MFCAVSITNLPFIENTVKNINYRLTSKRGEEKNEAKESI